MIANPDGGNLLQSASFAKVKADYGWKPRYIVYEGTVDHDGERQPFASYSLAFEKNIPLLGKLWYFIKGPAVHDADELPALLQANRRLITEQKLGVLPSRSNLNRGDGACPAGHCGHRADSYRRYSAE